LTIEELEPRIVARGRDFFAGIRNEVPSLFNKSLWTGKVMDWCMKNDAFKVQLFRFVDVFPSLTSGRSLSRHILEYFGGENQDVPSILKWGAKGAGLAGAVGAKVLSTAIRMNIQNMAKLFIVGETTKDAVRNLLKLRKQGFAFTVDVLGEATVSEEEAERYVAAYLDLLGEMEAEQAKWETLRGNSHAGEADDLDWGHSPKINISVKPSALYSQANPADFEGSVQNILARMERIYERVVDLGGFMCVDVESYKYKDITLEVFRRLRSRPRFRDYPHLGIVLQSYLRDNDGDLNELLDWAKQEDLSISIRLVKGAYWDYETVVAKQNGWEIPVYTHKSETDAAYERQARKILENQATPGDGPRARCPCGLLRVPGLVRHGRASSQSASEASQTSSLVLSLWGIDPGHGLPRSATAGKHCQRVFPPTELRGAIRRRAAPRESAEHARTRTAWITARITRGAQAGQPRFRLHERAAC